MNWLGDKPTIDLAQVLVGATLASATYGLFRKTRDVATETGILARETSDLSKGTLAATSLADVHHRDTLRPLMYLDIVLTLENRQLGSDEPWMFRAKGSCRNVGPGPAHDVFAYIGIDGYTAYPLDIGWLAAGEVREIDESIMYNYTSKVGEHYLAQRIKEKTFRDKGQHIYWPFESSVIYKSIFFDEPPRRTNQVSPVGWRMAMRIEIEHNTTKGEYGRAYDEYEAKFKPIRLRDSGQRSGT